MRTTGSEAGSETHTTNFTYDEENRPTVLTYENGQAVTYTYDALGRIQKRSVGFPEGSEVETTYTYVPGANGATTPLIQTISQNGVTLTYVYDDNGNITSVSDGTKTTSYEYDAIGQLIRVNDQTDETAGSTGTTWIFTYDLGGNILTKVAYPYTTGTLGTATESHTYTYGNAGWKDQLTAFDGVTITYDSIGNPLNDGTWTYTWQHGKQLASMSKTGETVSFEYNEDGLRTKKTATSTGTTEYTLHGKNIVHLKNGTDEMHFFYDAQGKPSVVVYGGNKYRYMYNLQGDVIGLVDENGSLVVQYKYDAWGEPTGKAGILAGTLGTVQPFRYRGYVFDEETGDYSLCYRYFNPYHGRFVSADYLEVWNQFCYCEDDPVSSVDPYGLLSSTSAPQSTFYTIRGLGEKNTKLPTPTNLSVFPERQQHIKLPENIGPLSLNEDNTYSLYDNKRNNQDAVFHEQLIVFTPVLETGLPSLINTGGDVDFITGGWEIDANKKVAFDLSLLDLLHAEAKATLGISRIEASLLASIWSPSISLSIGNIEVQFGAEVGSIGLQAGIGNDRVNFSIADGVGFSISLGLLQSKE